MRVTIISDNTVYPVRNNSSNGVYKEALPAGSPHGEAVGRQGLRSEWGFSCLVEVENTPKILFDTGASGSILLHNMEKLNIDPKSIDCIFISHDHWDHTGGLEDFLNINNDVKLYLPYSFYSQAFKAKEVVKVKDPINIYQNVYSIGELEGIEQSMVIKLNQGLVAIAGCSHPGVGNILNSTKQFGKVIALIGGLHGFSDFDLVKDLNIICATHCTQYKDKIKNLYPEKFIEGGAGREIEI